MIKLAPVIDRLGRDERFRVRVVDNAVGGHDSRSVFFDVATGEVEVRVPGQEIRKRCL